MPLTVRDYVGGGTFRIRPHWLLCGLLALGGCGGGDEAPSTAQPTQPSTPSPPTTNPTFNCSGYRAQVLQANNIIELRLPPGRVPATAPDALTVREWVACLARAASFTEGFEHIFLVNMVSRTPATAPYDGRSHQVSNFVTGIGRPVSESWNSWGVQDTLVSVVHFPAIESFLYGPKLHELAHAWAVSVLAEDESSGWEGHWAFSSANGQLGGFDRGSLRYLGPDGTCAQAYAAARTPYRDPNDPTSLFFGPNANGGDEIPYSAIELYLMGHLDASSLPGEFVVAPNASFIGNSRVKFCAPVGVRVYPTRVWIESKFGPRSPTAAQVRSEHKVLFVAVTMTDAPPVLEEGYKTLDYACEVQKFVKPGTDGRPGIYNFWEATGGRGTLKTPALNSTCLTCNPDGIQWPQAALKCP